MAPANSTIVVVSGSYNSTTELNAQITTSGLTIEGWSYFAAAAQVSNPDPAHINAGKLNPSLQSILDTAVYTVNASNVTLEGFSVIDQNTAGGIIVQGGTGSLITSNTFDNNETGIAVQGGSATISNNTFTNSTLAISLQGGTTNIRADSISSSMTGVDVTGGSAVISGVNFDAGLTTYISDESKGTVNASGNTFGGVNTAFPGTTNDQYFAIENKISDNLDLTQDGFVELNPSKVFVTQLSENTTAAHWSAGLWSRRRMAPCSRRRGSMLASLASTIR